MSDEECGDLDEELCLLDEATDLASEEGPSGSPLEDPLNLGTTPSEATMKLQKSIDSSLLF